MRRFLLLIVACQAPELQLAVQPHVIELGASGEAALDVATDAREVLLEGAPAGVSARRAGDRLLVTASGARPGSYTLEVVARDGERAAREPVSLLVRGAPFSLSAAPISIPQGGEARARVTADYDGLVELGAIPSAGLTADPLSFRGEGSLRVAASALAPRGSAALELFATAGGASARFTLPITITPPSGTLDTTFGRDGLFIESLLVEGQGPVDITGMALQPDGKMLVSGEYYRKGAQYDVYVARYLPGSTTLDASFGSGGYVLYDLGTQDFDLGSTLALQPDGKILVAGSRGYTEIAVMRLGADGSLDASFASGGIFIGLKGGFYTAGGLALGLQKDGKIVFGGYSDNHVKLGRLTSSGALDSSFGNGGVLSGPSGGVAALRVLPDDSILACGWDLQDWLVWKRAPDGAPDFSVTIDFGHEDRAQGLTLDAKGRIVIAGAAGTSGLTAQLALARLLPDGKLDASFGSGGKSIAGPAGGKGSSPILIQPDGKILAGGGSSYGGSASMLLARVLEDGAMDTSFNGTGRVYTSFGAKEQWLRHLAWQNDGTILALGYATLPAQNAVMARYFP